MRLERLANQNHTKIIGRKEAQNAQGDFTLSASTGERAG
jgi:hypothetical protein